MADVAEKTCRSRDACLHPEGPHLTMSHFYKDKSRPDGHRYECKACQRQYDRKVYLKDSVKHIERAKRRQRLLPDATYLNWIKRKYSVSPETYDRMMKEQNGLCGICGNAQTRANSDRLCIDHAHGTDPILVRGLLCDRCNHAIGLVDESPDILRSMIRYLEKSHA